MPIQGVNATLSCKYGCILFKINYILSLRKLIVDRKFYSCCGYCAVYISYIYSTEEALSQEIKKQFAYYDCPCQRPDPCRLVISIGFPVNLNNADPSHQVHHQLTRLRCKHSQQMQLIDHSLRKMSSFLLEIYVRLINGYFVHEKRKLFSLYLDKLSNFCLLFRNRLKGLVENFLKT